MSKPKKKEQQRKRDDARLGRLLGDRVIQKYFGLLGLALAQDDEIRSGLLKIIASVPGSGVEMVDGSSEPSTT